MRQLLEPLLALFGGLDFPGGAQQIQSLAWLILRQLIEHVANLVIAAALHLLAGAKNFFDGCPQSFGAIDHKQIFAISRQALIP